MKRLLTMGLAAVLIGAAPAFADDDDRRGRGKHWNKHVEKQWKKDRKHWAKHHHRHHVHTTHVVHQHVVAAPVVEHRVIERHVIHQHVVPVAPAPAPGVHVVMRSLFVPF